MCALLSHSPNTPPPTLCLLIFCDTVTVSTVRGRGVPDQRAEEDRPAQEGAGKEGAGPAETHHGRRQQRRRPQNRAQGHQEENHPTDEIQRGRGKPCLCYEALGLIGGLGSMTPLQLCFFFQGKLAEIFIKKKKNLP